MVLKPLIGEVPRDALVVYEGTTDVIGNAGATTLKCSDIGSASSYPDFDGNQIILTSGSYKGQARDINGSTNSDAAGTVTVANAFDGQIPSGTSFTITGIRTVPAEVADIQADLGDKSDAALGKDTDDDGTQSAIALLRSIIDRLGNVGTSNIDALADSILADIGDASGATLLSLYGILGNPSHSLSATILDGIDARTNNSTLISLLGYPDIANLTSYLHSLSTRIYDNFDDNSKNINIWDTDSIGNDTVISETGTKLKISNPGTGTAGYSYRPTIKTFGRSLEISADIEAVDEEADVEAYIELYKESENYFQFGIIHNATTNSRGFVTHNINNAGEATDDVDTTDIDAVARNYKIIVDEHSVHVYLDRTLEGTYTFETLTEYTVRLVAGTGVNADVMDIRFNNFLIAPYSEHHRALYAELESIQGGSESIQTVHDIVDAINDLDRAGDSGAKVMDGNPIVLYEETSTSAFEFGGTWIDWSGLNVGAGEDTTVTVEIKTKSGGTYREIYNEVFLAAALPSPICTPVPRESTSQPTPSRIYNMYGVKVTATQAAQGGGWNTLETESYDSKV